jgi:hypothetical protein
MTPSTFEIQDTNDINSDGNTIATQAFKTGTNTSGNFAFSFVSVSPM